MQNSKFFIEKQANNGTMQGYECKDGQRYYSDVFLMSLILFLGTYIISVVLKDFKNALFFPAKVKNSHKIRK